MKLVDGIEHKTYQISEIHLNTKLAKRLEILGAYQDSSITVWQKKRSGTMIVMIRGIRWAIGRAIALGIEVREAAADGE